MKSRVIFSDRQFIAQIKTDWWSGWHGVHWCKFGERYYLGIEDRHSTLEKAIAVIQEYKDQKVDDGKVVWEGK